MLFIFIFLSFDNEQQKGTQRISSVSWTRLQKKNYIKLPTDKWKILVFPLLLCIYILRQPRKRIPFHPLNFLCLPYSFGINNENKEEKEEISVCRKTEIISFWLNFFPYSLFHSQDLRRRYLIK